MKIGLYSELARQHIVKIREEISQLGLKANAQDIRSFRNRLVNSDKDHHRQMIHSSDFYSFSTLRDLLFHVQEHRFTLLQIKECLGDLGLKFLGIEDDEIVRDFKLKSGDKNTLYELDKWRLYEEANPTAFLGMYQFWCQKAD